jgi:hypothetical protein
MNQDAQMKMQTKHLKLLAKQKRRKDPDVDPKAPDSDAEERPFDWQTWRREAILGKGSHSSLGTDFLDNPHNVGKLLHQRDAANGESATQRPFLSHKNIMAWEPPYITTELPEAQRKGVIERRKSAPSSCNRLLGNVVTWGLVHIALEQFTLVHLFQHITNLLRITDVFDIATAVTYHNRLIAHCERKINAGQAFAIGPKLSVIDDSIITDLRLRGIEASKEKGTPKGPKGDPKGRHKGNLGKGDLGKGIRSKKEWKGDPKAGRKGDHLRANPRGKGPAAGPFICFKHDPRNGKQCIDAACLADPSKEHLETADAHQGARFDRAQAIFEARKKKGSRR